MLMSGAPPKPPCIRRPRANGFPPGPDPSGAAAIGALTNVTVDKAATALPRSKDFILFITPPSGLSLSAKLDDARSGRFTIRRFGGYWGAFSGFLKKGQLLPCWLENDGVIVR